MSLQIAHLSADPDAASGLSSDLTSVLTALDTTSARRLAYMVDGAESGTDYILALVWSYGS